VIKNYTTTVPENRTVMEIQELLAGKGARSISVDYDDERRPDAVSFVIAFDNFPIPFRLPCNFKGVHRFLAKNQPARSSHRKRIRTDDEESVLQSRRIAWRIIKDWVAAQIALIEAEQATLAQVFLPYAVVHEGHAQITMYDRFLGEVSKQKALGRGDPPPEKKSA
jgi:hypothetical protein